MDNKDNKEKKNNGKEVFKYLKDTPRGRAILFFVGYFFFFIFVIVFVRFMGEGTSSGSVEYDEPKDYFFSVANIEKGNYAFKHSLAIDDTEVIFTGTNYDNKSLFTMSSVTGSYDFYRDDLDYFSNTNGLWIKSENPYTQENFFDIDVIKILIDKSTYVYKTEYESGKKVYSFKISTTTIYDYFEGIDLDLADDANEILVIVDEDNSVSKFEFKLNSYCKAVELCNEKMIITLTYNRYGEIEEITSPLD